MSDYIIAERVPPVAESVGRPRGWAGALAAMLLVGLALTLWWIDPRQVGLPLCMFHYWTGLCCPGCGATRATHDLLHGRLLAALHGNALWVALMPLALYAAVSQVRYLAVGRPLPGSLSRRPWLLIAIVVAAIAFGLLRNIPSWPFFLLAPPP